MFKVDHIGVVVTNAERSKEFYQKAFGCKVVDDYRDERVRLVFLELGGQVIELVHYLTKPAEERSKGVVDHIAFTVESLDTALAHLKPMGVKMLSDAPLLVNGKKVIFFAGPDGERLELCEIVE